MFGPEDNANVPIGIEMTDYAPCALTVLMSFEYCAQHRRENQPMSESAGQVQVLARLIGRHALPKHDALSIPNEEGGGDKAG